MNVRSPHRLPMARLPASRGAALAGGLVFLTCFAIGCEQIIPRNDLQVLARTLPPGPEVTDVQRQEMRNEIRDRTGVSGFEFSESQFEPEMKLPGGIAWIMGLFIADQDSPPQTGQVSE